MVRNECLYGNDFWVVTGKVRSRWGRSKGALGKAGRRGRAAPPGRLRWGWLHRLLAAGVGPQHRWLQGSRTGWRRTGRVMEVARKKKGEWNMGPT
jgi:hypothetical protein